MGLTNWKNSPDGKVLKSGIIVAKNYLNKKELSKMNRIVTMFIDYAEMQAEDGILMSMQDWGDETNRFLENNRRKVLSGTGKVSHEAAVEKATNIKLSKETDTQKLFSRIESLKYECGGECNKIEKLNNLQIYLLNNQNGLVSYKKKLDIPKPPDGLYYRNLGTMEHNIFDVLGHRMKRRKMSWSIDGANNIAKILAVKASNKLYEVIPSLLSSTLPVRVQEVFEEVVKQVSEKIKPTSKIYPTHDGEIPFGNCVVTNGRKA